jgi:hypothetical protein
VIFRDNELYAIPNGLFMGVFCFKKLNTMFVENRKEKHNVLYRIGDIKVVAEKHRD